jgi:hypothetical protein
MVNPINETASVSINAEVINKSQNNTAPKSDKPVGSPDIKKSGREGADHSTMKGAIGEIRKSELSDGELTVSVYDSSGKLLRKIPPGYLPVGEQQFDITV